MLHDQSDENSKIQGARQENNYLTKLQTIDN